MHVVHQMATIKKHVHVMCVYVCINARSYHMYSWLQCAGGVGFDINCGVRLVRTNLFEKDVRPIKEQLAQVHTSYDI